MKALKYLVLGCLSVGFLISCESFLAEDINVDPNKPSNVPVSAMLPNIEIRVVDVYGGDTSRFNSMLSQQVEGVARQWTSFNNYSGLTPNRFDTAWDNYYENILVEVNNMIAAADDLGYSHYSGIGKILKGFALMNMTDCWGNVPYFQAAVLYPNASDAELILSPEIDSRSAIYDEVLSLINEGESALNGGNGGLAVGSDDVIYGGDIAKWLDAVKAIKARYYLHKGDYAQAASNARDAFESPEDNMSYTYSASQQAGWWRFNDGRTGDIEFHPFLRDLMTDLGDTARLAILDQTFITSHPYHKADYEQDLVSYREMQFIIAESLQRTGGSAAQISDAYFQGIAAAFFEVGATEADLLAYVNNQDVALDGTSGDLKKILTQKYLGLYTHPEVFNDLRRNDYPDLGIDSSFSPTSGSLMPQRWNYPGDELLFNQNFADQIGSATLFSPAPAWGSGL